MAKRIPKKTVYDLSKERTDAGSDRPSSKEPAFCDVCGRPSDELKGGRCPKCFAKVIKELHSARGLRGF